MLDWLKGAALVAFIGLCISTSYEVVTVGKHLSNTLMAANDTMAKVNGKYGTLVQLDKTLVNTKELIQHADGLLTEESTSLKSQNDQIAATVVNVQHVLAQTSATLQQTSSSEAEMSHAAVESTVALNKVILDVSPVLSSATVELQTLQSTTAHLDALIQDPNIRQTIAHTDATMAHVEATTKDVQQEVHSLTHPTILHKIWGGLLDVAHVFNPL